LCHRHVVYCGDGDGNGDGDNVTGDSVRMVICLGGDGWGQIQNRLDEWGLGLKVIPVQLSTLSLILKGNESSSLKLLFKTFGLLYSFQH